MDGLRKPRRSRREPMLILASLLLNGMLIFRQSDTGGDFESPPAHHFFSCRIRQLAATLLSCRGRVAAIRKNALSSEAVSLRSNSACAMGSFLQARITSASSCS